MSEVAVASGRRPKASVGAASSCSGGAVRAGGRSTLTVDADAEEDLVDRRLPAAALALRVVVAVGRR